MNRAWTTVGAIAIAVLLQVAVAPHIALLGVVPSFPLLVVITLAFFDGAAPGAVAGFACGLMLDLLGSGPIGAWALVLSVVGYMTGMLEANVFAEGWLLPVTVALIAGLVAEFSYLVVMLVLGLEINFWSTLWQVVLPGGVYNSVLALLLYPWLARFLRTDRSVRSFRRLA
ncbi:MAG: rod shape-determining protein [Actinobacteria bacterium]|nr:MAG: rod shape-determining protein [Actinomycetota bacterium]